MKLIFVCLGLLKTAFALEKPQFIYFHATWCPPCNQMEETVLQSAAFKEKVLRWKYSEVDVDKKEAWHLKSKYKVTGYPTFLFLNTQGEETLRIVGSREKSEFIRLMDLAFKLKTKPSTTICRSERVDFLWACAVSSMEKKDKKMVSEIFAKLSKKQKSENLLSIKTFLIENEETADLKKYGFEKLMSEFPESPLATAWALNYLEFFDFKNTKPNLELIQKVVTGTDRAKKDPNLPELGITLADIEQMKAGILLATGKLEEARRSFLAAKDILETEAAKLPKESSRKGYDLDIIYCLEMGGKPEEALKLSQINEVKYPKDFTFYFKTATILEKRKKYSEALLPAKKAYENGYGDNKIRAGTLLLKLLAPAHNPTDAKKIQEEIRQLPRPETSLEVRTHRYLKEFEEVYRKFFSPTSP